MVRALAGDSTMTRFLGTGGSVALAPWPTLQTSRIRRRKSSSISRSASTSATGGGGWCAGSSSGSTATAIDASLPVAAPGGISTNRMWRYGKKKIDLISSTKTGRLPFIIRRLVQRNPTSPGDGVSNRSARSGCSLFRWRMTLRITLGWSSGPAPAVTPPMVRSGVVEVDHQPDAATRDPDPDADLRVLGAHHVHVVAAVVRLLALEEQVRAKDGRFGAARPAADVLCPPIARVAGPSKPVAWAAADEVRAGASDREQPGVRSRDLRADPGTQPQRSDVATSRTAA